MFTKEYKYARYPFQEFNPVQTEAFKYLEEESNIIISAPTSSGKTVAGELYAGKALHEGETVLYLSPLKALAEEKLNDWQTENHPWADTYDQPFVMTGDYRLTEEREKQLQEAHLILATYEMFNVRCRRASLENIQWLQYLGVLIVDEAHFLGDQERGHHLESALMLFTKINPHARIIFLSATMANTDELAKWLTLLNNYNTRVIESNYRPTKLNIHGVFYTLPRMNSWQLYRERLNQLILTAIELIEEFPFDQWLIFVHTKPAGRQLQEVLNKKFLDKIIAFHNADLEREERLKIEANFKAKKINYLIATSTLAYGVNLPARRVIILGVLRGLSKVEVSDIIQECGRAGRPKYDTEGDAYILLEERKEDYWLSLLQAPFNITSKFKEYLPFHLISEIAEKRVENADSAKIWLSRSLNCDGFDGTKIFDDFKTLKLIKEDTDTTSDWQTTGSGLYRATSLGAIAAYNYQDPYAVKDWQNNLQLLKSNSLLMEPAALAWAIANSAKYQYGYLPKELKSFTNNFTAQRIVLNLAPINDAKLTIATLIYLQLEGEEVMKQFRAYFWGFWSDLDRTLTTLQQICERTIALKLDNYYWDKLNNRLRYGLNWEEAELALLPGIGQTYARVLYANGFKTLRDLDKGRNKMLCQLLPKRLLTKIKQSLQEFINN